MHIIPPELIAIRRDLCRECAPEDPCAVCAHGHWGQYEASKCAEAYSSEAASFGLGDAVAAIATPIARVLKMGCIDPATQQLRPESGCAKRKTKLNELGRKLGL